MKIELKCGDNILFSDTQGGDPMFSVEIDGILSPTEFAYVSKIGQRQYATVIHEKPKPKFKMGQIVRYIDTLMWIEKISIRDEHIMYDLITSRRAAYHHQVEEDFLEKLTDVEAGR